MITIKYLLTYHRRKKSEHDTRKDRLDVVLRHTRYIGLNNGLAFRAKRRKIARFFPADNRNAMQFQLNSSTGLRLIPNTNSYNTARYFPDIPYLEISYPPYH